MNTFHLQAERRQQTTLSASAGSRKRLPALRKVLSACCLILLTVGGPLLPLSCNDRLSQTDGLAASLDSLAMDCPIVVEPDMRLTPYASQMDADTALLGKSALGGTTCVSRLNLYRKQGRAQHLEVLCHLEKRWSLVVYGGLRAHKVRDLKGLTIATARDDASAVICDRMIKEAGLNPKQVYHPQINSLDVRLQMLTNNQTDAAMLPEAYAAEARRLGHRILQTITDTAQTVVVVRRTLDAAQKDKLRTALTKAH